MALLHKKSCSNKSIKNPWGHPPGTVNTELSKPFQSHPPESQLFTKHQAAELFSQMFKEIRLEDSGGLFDWQDKTPPNFKEN